jgi:hypothetical protein
VKLFGNPLTFTRAHIYLSTPATPAMGSVTPLLLDSDGHALSFIDVSRQRCDGARYTEQRTGIVNSINPGFYEVPRHATNLFFYNVSTPDDWVAEYHCIFAGQVPYDRFTYQQMLDNVSPSARAC